MAAETRVDLVSKCEKEIWSELDRMMSDFVTRHQHVFRELHETFGVKEDQGRDEIHDVDSGHGEHKLKYSELHSECKALLEEKLDHWAEKSGIDVNEFLVQIQAVLEGRFVPLFEEHDNKPFVDVIMSLIDYDSFLSTMIFKLVELNLAPKKAKNALLAELMKRRKRKGKRDGDSGKSGGGKEGKEADSFKHK